MTFLADDNEDDKGGNRREIKGIATSTGNPSE